MAFIFLILFIDRIANGCNACSDHRRINNDIKNLHIPSPALRHLLNGEWIVVKEGRSKKKIKSISSISLKPRITYATAKSPFSHKKTVFTHVTVGNIIDIKHTRWALRAHKPSHMSSQEIKYCQRKIPIAIKTFSLLQSLRWWRRVPSSTAKR